MSSAGIVGKAEMQAGLHEDKLREGVEHLAPYPPDTYRRSKVFGLEQQRISICSVGRG